MSYELSFNALQMTTSTMFLSPDELARYNRQLILPEFGVAAQQKLKAAKVLVIGAGGLGGPVLMYLAAAGVGVLGIVDFDVVDVSNLQRQVLFETADIGHSKVEAAKKRLHALNPLVDIRLHLTRLTSDNALDIIREYDVVVDGSDNFPTRYLVNDACVLLDKVVVFGAISQFEGQVSVFHYKDSHGIVGPNYRDLHPTPPAPGTVRSCAEAGVLGVLPGIIGVMQANEVIKVITGIGVPLSGRLFHFDALQMESRMFNFKRRDDNPLNGSDPTIDQLINYDLFCGMSTTSNPMKEISAAELNSWRLGNEVFQLIDVREPEEYTSANLGGELIPLSTILEEADRVSRDVKVVLHCLSGERSAHAIRNLEKTYGFDNLYNLKGGMLGFLGQ